MSLIMKDKTKLSPIILSILLAGNVYAAAGLERRNKFFSVADTGKIKLKEIKTFKGYHKGFFSPDGRALALLDKDHIDVVEVAGGRKLYRISLPKSLFLNAAFSPDARLIAVAYRENSGADTSVIVTLRNASTGQRIQSLPVIDREWQREVDLSFSGDSRLLATNLGGVARLWDLAGGKEFRQFPPPPEQPAVVPQRTLLSPDGKWLAVYFKHKDVRHHSDAIHIWELATGRKQAVMKTGVYRDWKFSHDSTMLVMTASTDIGKITQRAVAEVWAVGGGERLRVIEVPRAWQGAFTLSFAPNGKLLAIGGRYRFGIFSVSTGKLITQERHHGEHFWASNTIVFDVSHVEFSPDGRLLLTGGNDGIVKLWSFDDGAV